MATYHHDPMSKKTTLESIAKASGLSIATVDRVINRRGGVSPKSEAKVLEWANRLQLDRRIFRTNLKALRIAVLIPSTTNPFFLSMKDAFQAISGHAAEGQIQIFIHTTKPTDHSTTARKIGELATAYDGLIVCCPDQPDIFDALQRAAQHVPVVTLVSDIPNSGRLAYVGPDNRRIGRVAGELMGRFIGQDGGKVLVMLGHSSIIGHQEREMGFRAVTRERFPKIEILDIAESEEDSSRAASIAQAALRTEPNIRGIYNVSAGNYQIAQTLRSLDLGSEVVFITHELTPKRREMLRDGLLDAVIDQNPRLEARKAIDIIAYSFGRLEQAQMPDPFTPFEIFLRENCPIEM